MTDQLRTLWQSQKAESLPLPLSELLAAAPRLERHLKRRNTVEYAAGGLTMLVFAAYAVHFSDPMMRLGSLLIVAATAFVMRELYRRARVGAHDPVQSLAAFHRAELERQRSALARVGLWYLAPFVPGYLLFNLGFVFTQPHPSWLALLINLTIGAATFGLIWWVNTRAAHRLALRIEALDALMREEN